MGPLEMEIVGMMERDKPISVATVRERLKRGGRELAYTTVMTVLARLHSKKILSRVREGRGYLYYAAKDVGEMKESLLARMGRSLFGRERLQPILAFLEDDTELSAAELEELRDIVDLKLKEKGKKR